MGSASGCEPPSTSDSYSTLMSPAQYSRVFELISAQCFFLRREVVWRWKAARSAHGLRTKFFFLSVSSGLMPSFQSFSARSTAVAHRARAGAGEPYVTSDLSMARRCWT